MAIARFTMGKYANKEGQTVYTTDVIIEECEFAESKDASERSRQTIAVQHPRLPAIVS